MCRPGSDAVSLPRPSGPGLPVRPHRSLRDRLPGLAPGTAAERRVHADQHLRQLRLRARPVTALRKRHRATGGGVASRGRARSRGQAMVEFAFIAPILFVLVLGTIEAARLVFYLELLNHAAREGDGIRSGSAHPVAGSPFTSASEIVM